jgi:hypothetical protein
MHTVLRSQKNASLQITCFTFEDVCMVCGRTPCTHDWRKAS